MKPGRVRFVCNVIRASVQYSAEKMFTAMLQWADPTRATDKSPRSTTAQCFLPHTRSTSSSWPYSSHNCERALGQNKNSRLFLQQQGTKIQATPQFGMIRGQILEVRTFLFCFNFDFFCQLRMITWKGSYQLNYPMLWCIPVLKVIFMCDSMQNACANEQC